MTTPTPLHERIITHLIGPAGLTISAAITWLIRRDLASILVGAGSFTLTFYILPILTPRLYPWINRS